MLLFVWPAKRVGKSCLFYGNEPLDYGAGGTFSSSQGLMYVPRGDGRLWRFHCYLIPWSMMPDVIELDELTTGQRREGFLWLHGFAEIRFSFRTVPSGIALEWSGFKETIAGQAIPEQPASALNARVAIGPLPTLCLFGLILAYFYPITREVHAEILLKLKQRQTRELS